MERCSFQFTAFRLKGECLQSLPRRQTLRREPGDKPMTLPSARLPRSAVIREVGLRDGLQSIATILPTAQKVEWIRAAYEAGQREIEVGSLVPARLLPQLADTAELVAFAKSLPSLCTSVLVPNLRGAESAIAAKADLMIVPL